MCLVEADGRAGCRTCRRGFELREGVCVDVNECARPESNRCHAHALCMNLVGSYQCQCQPGMRGDGFHCADIDECAELQPCHPQAHCSNLHGTYMCTCPPGWRGDGRYECLNPEDERCHLKADLCTSQNFAACLALRVAGRARPSSFCECQEGYRYNVTTKQCDGMPPLLWCSTPRRRGRVRGAPARLQPALGQLLQLRRRAHVRLPARLRGPGRRVRG